MEKPAVLLEVLPQFITNLTFVALQIPGDQNGATNKEPCVPAACAIGSLGITWTILKVGAAPE